MNNLKITFLILTILFLSSCANRKITLKNYYTLEYNQAFEQNDLHRELPFDYSILIKDAQIPSTYNRKQIVVRESPNKITYAMNDIWGVKLTDKIPELMAIRMLRYNFFKNIQRDYSSATPDYEVNIRVRNIEYISYGGEQSAHLNMEIELYDMSENIVAVRYNLNKHLPLQIDDKELFIQAINSIILESTDEFLKRIKSFIIEGESSLNDYAIEGNPFDEKIDLGADYNLELDDDLLSKGQIILPNKTDPDQEPFVEVYQNNKLITEHMMGSGITLDPGKYTIVLGSGSEKQRIEKDVEVVTRYKKVITPDWSWLTVNLTDENRNSVDVQYELFDLETGESFGIGRGVQEELGEQLETWILKPGKYKIVLSGEAFNTERNYVTVDLQEGELEEFNIVIEEDSGNLLGGGSLTKLDDSDSVRKWKMSSSIHGNANLTSDNATDKNNRDVNVSINTQFDNKAVYDIQPYHVTLRFLLEGELSSVDRSDLNVTNDDITIKSTFIYYVLKNIGIYTRADVNTHYYNTYVETDDPKHYAFYDVDGNLNFQQEQEKVKVQSPIFPSEFKEGIGLNYRALNSAKYKMNIRAGFGLTQNINNDVFTYVKSDSLTYNDNYFSSVEFYEEVESVYSQGIEMSLVSSFDLPLNINFSTDADVLFPFDDEEENDYRMENKLSMKLLRHISLDYNIDLSYNKNIKDYVEISNKLYLRFTYFIY